MLLQTDQEQEATILGTKLPAQQERISDYKRR